MSVCILYSMILSRTFWQHSARKYVMFHSETLTCQVIAVMSDNADSILLVSLDRHANLFSHVPGRCRRTAAAHPTFFIPASLLTPAPRIEEHLSVTPQFLWSFYFRS